MIVVFDLLERNVMHEPSLGLDLTIGYDEGELRYQMESTPTTLPMLRRFFEKDWGVKRRLHLVSSLRSFLEPRDRIAALGMRHVYNLWRMPVDFGYVDQLRTLRHHKGSFTAHELLNNKERLDWGDTPLDQDYQELCAELVAECARREPEEFDRAGKDFCFEHLGTHVLLLKDRDGVAQGYAAYSIEPAGHLYVWTAYVRPAYRSTRLFGVLVSLLLAAARDAGCQWVAASTDGTSGNLLPRVFAKRGGDIVSETWMEI